MKLINPNTDLQKSYVSYIGELGEEERYPYPLDLKHKDFNWLVPNTTFWLVEGNEILGCSHLRHCLNAELEMAGGHIGLGIRPSARGKGLGKILLNATIDKAVKMGIEKIHIHCDADNIQSRRMIESIGAVLESAINLDLPQKTVMRYIHDCSYKKLSYSLRMLGKLTSCPSFYSSAKKDLAHYLGFLLSVNTWRVL